jgi:hypothetical protein
MKDWNLVEKNISNVIDFLSNNILLSPFRQNDPIQCRDCIFRQIAILIISGKIKVKKIINSRDKLWPINEPQNTIINNKKSHGADWHNSLINQIKNYFENNKYSAKLEPALHYGRADLGVPGLNLFVEVGTINIYKLYNNLINMVKCKILVVPDNHYIIEFSL